MTREQAIKILKPILDSFVDYANITMKVEDDNIVDALEMAIEALEPPEIIRCGECKYKKDHHYENPGEEPYIKSTCENKYGLVKNYQVHDWDFCSRAERRIDGNDDT